MAAIVLGLFGIVLVMFEATRTRNEPNRGPGRMVLGLALMALGILVGGWLLVTRSD